MDVLVGARPQREIGAPSIGSSPVDWTATTSAGERTISGMLKAPSGDFRDWHAIRDWADEIAAELRAEPVGAGGC